MLNYYHSYDEKLEKLNQASTEMIQSFQQIAKTAASFGISLSEMINALHQAALSGNKISLEKSIKEKDNSDFDYYYEIPRYDDLFENL